MAEVESSTTAGGQSWDQDGGTDSINQLYKTPTDTAFNAEFSVAEQYSGTDSVDMETLEGIDDKLILSYVLSKVVSGSSGYHRPLKNPQDPREPQNFYGLTVLNRALNSFKQGSDLTGGEEATSLSDSKQKDQSNIDIFQTNEFQESLNTEVVDEINKRVISPIIFMTGMLLLAASVGVFLSGEILLSLVILPGPLMAAWALWKSRNI